jgi:threonine dehydrogenase-like Zn-dependent dehydrogenase
MKAVCWMGVEDMRVENVPDPEILNPRDAIVRITSTCICGSDLHLYNGYIPTMEQGDIMGHEFMGEVVEVGGAIRDKLKIGDRVVVPFTIACGRCFFCQKQLWSCCDNSNPNYWIAEQMMGYSPSGLFGYTHMMGGYSGGQAQYARVPFADVGPLKLPEGIPDDKLVFLSDIFPTGYFGAVNADIEPGDTVAVWGCGPVGQFAIRSCFMLGAGRVIAIDRFDYRLSMAKQGGAETINYEEVDNVAQTLKEMTANVGPTAALMRWEWKHTATA